MHKNLKITHGPAEAPETELLIGEGLLFSDRLKELIGPGPAILVADPLLKDLYATPLAHHLGAELILLSPGKSQQAAEELLQELFKRGAGRDTTLLALGGGTTTDLVGFVASIYLRGLPVIYLPTTLVGMVDAAIGGKTAIDLPWGKNLLGSFSPPKAICADLDTLASLSEAERLNGLAEILKMALICDVGVDLEAAMRAKIAIVEQDPKERSIRRILNFGHTIGHAIEAVSGYAMAHGQAVALGCLTESYLSLQLGYLSPTDFAKIEQMFTPFSLRLPPSYSREKFLAALCHDKKKAAGQVRFVLIDRIGHAMAFGGAYCAPVGDLTPTLAWMEGRFL